MTDIDPQSDIELRTVNEHVIARVPLAGLAAVVGRLLSGRCLLGSWLYW